MEKNNLTSSLEDHKNNTQQQANKILGNTNSKLILKANNEKLPTLQGFKQKAKELKLSENLDSHSQALNELSKIYGYRDYNTIKPNLLKTTEDIFQAVMTDLKSRKKEGFELMFSGDYNRFLELSEKIAFEYTDGNIIYLDKKATLIKSNELNIISIRNEKDYKRFGVEFATLMDNRNEKRKVLFFVNLKTLTTAAPDLGRKTRYDNNYFIDYSSNKISNENKNDLKRVKEGLFGY